MAAEVVDAITATGGKFRKQTGGVMNRSDAIRKTIDRFRQIGKPKLRPTGFGEYDVVFAKGAANFLYPGNVKWRQLCDEYVLSYYRELVDEDGNVVLDERKSTDTTTGTLVCSQEEPKHQRQADGKFKKGIKLFKRIRPQYQFEIIDEILKIIHGRGGVFRDEMLNVLSDQDAGTRVHARFKDLKKQLLAGTRIFVPRDKKELLVAKTEDHGDGGNQCILPDLTISSTTENTTENNKKTDDSSATITGTDIFHHRLGGFTSVKVYVRSIINEKKALERKERSERRRNRRKMGLARGRGKSKRGSGTDSSDDDNSFQSNMLDSDNDSISSSDGDDDDDDDDTKSEYRAIDAKDDVAPKQISKQKQDEEREERLKRRMSGIVNQQPPVETMKTKRRRRRRIATRNADEESSTHENDDDHPLSEYEMYRLEKIKRNEEKLAELGLGKVLSKN